MQSAVTMYVNNLYLACFCHISYQNAWNSSRQNAWLTQHSPFKASDIFKDLYRSAALSITIKHALRGSCVWTFLLIPISLLVSSATLVLLPQEEKPLLFTLEIYNNKKKALSCIYKHRSENNKRGFWASVRECRYNTKLDPSVSS